jgi:predicted transcriptional regulator
MDIAGMRVMTETTVIVRVEDELKTAFTQAAKAADRTASQLLRDFMRDYVKRQAEQAEYDAWLRQKVRAGRAAARTGRVRSSEEVEGHFAERRKRSQRRTGTGR